MEEFKVGDTVRLRSIRSIINEVGNSEEELYDYTLYISLSTIKNMGRTSKTVKAMCGDTLIVANSPFSWALRLFVPKEVAESGV